MQQFLDYEPEFGKDKKIIYHKESAILQQSRFIDRKFGKDAIDTRLPRGVISLEDSDSRKVMRKSQNSVKWRKIPPTTKGHSAAICAPDYRPREAVPGRGIQAYQKRPAAS